MGAMAMPRLHRIQLRGLRIDWLRPFLLGFHFDGLLLQLLCMFDLSYVDVVRLRGQQLVHQRHLQLHLFRWAALVSQVRLPVCNVS